MGNIYNINPGDVFWAASDIGWVVGHSYIVYGPLIRGATAVMFEGKPVGTPDAAREQLKRSTGNGAIDKNGALVKAANLITERD